MIPALLWGKSWISYQNDVEIWGNLIDLAPEKRHALIGRLREITKIVVLHLSVSKEWRLRWRSVYASSNGQLLCCRWVFPTWVRPCIFLVLYTRRYFDRGRIYSRSLYNTWQHCKLKKFGKHQEDALKTRYRRPRHKPDLGSRSLSLSKQTFLRSVTQYAPRKSIW